MLLASGAGSAFSRTVVAGLDRRLMLVLAAVAALIALLAVTATPLVHTAATWPMFARILLAVAMIAPPAFFMGMPFPSGLRRLEERHAPSLRWAWSLNAAASVMGSVVSVVLAIYLGLRATLLIGGAMYLVALLIILITRRDPQTA
jgi:predicted MFS family arabinose efflux permease